MNARGVVLALTVGALVFSASDAFAGRRGKGRNAETIELVRPNGGSDFDAQGTVRITRGGRTTLDLSHLERRTRYEIRDGDSGALLGSVRTNRKGKATFDLTRSLAKSASVGGSDGVSNVDIVDPDTGEPVLSGDVEPEPELPQFGSAYYMNEKGDTADASLYSDPANEYESFAFTFFPAEDPSSTKYRFYELSLDTANGDKLPLGVESVAELAERRFQVIGTDGSVLIDDKLPALETLDCPPVVIDDPWYGDKWDDDWNGGWGGGWDDGLWEGHDKPYGDDGWFPEKPDYDDWYGYEKPGADDNAAGFLRGVKKSSRVKDEEVKGVELLIADADGVLKSAGFLNEQAYEIPDCPVVDYGDFDPFAGWGDGGDLIGFLFPDGSWDGDLDLAALLADLFGIDDLGSLLGGLKNHR